MLTKHKIKPIGYAVTKTNSTTGSANTTTYVYLAQLDNTTSLAQAYTFSTSASSKTFAGTNFTVGAAALKWSVNLTATDLGDVIAGIQEAGGFTLRYQLSNLLNASTAAEGVDSNAQLVTTQSDTPEVGMTTYVVRVGKSAVVQLAVFDVAVIDDEVVAIQHSLELDTASNSTTRNYTLELTFPAFNRSLFYDPSLGLGVLLGASSGSGGDSNTGLIVAVAVAVPVAVVIVLTVIVVGLVIGWRRKRSLFNKKSSLVLDDIPDDEEERGEL
jgi:hypothetical protein